MGLAAYIIRRLLLVVPTLIGVSLLVFAVSQMVDVNIRAMLYVTNEKMLDRIDWVISKYGLNDPFYLQYGRWLGEVLKGNLGWSKGPGANSPVWEALITRIPATFEITLFSAPVIILLGIYLGVQSAVHRDKIIDHITRTVSIIGWSLPSFWLGILLLSVFFGLLPWFPPRRLGSAAETFVNSRNFVKYTGLYTIDGLLNGKAWISIDALRHLVLPIIVLTTIQIALIVRVMRSSMLEALGKGYIVTAKAKGLSKDKVINKHARRNALIPVITLSGLLVAGMMNGLVITETVFAFPGIGNFAAQAAIQVDLPAVLGFALFSGIIFVFANLFVDILYAYIDPRIRLG